jgi:hypothetical protein
MAPWAHAETAAAAITNKVATTATKVRFVFESERNCFKVFLPQNSPYVWNPRANKKLYSQTYLYI